MGTHANKGEPRMPAGIDDDVDDSTTGTVVETETPPSATVGVATVAFWRFTKGAIRSLRACRPFPGMPLWSKARAREAETATAIREERIEAWRRG